MCVQTSLSGPKVDFDIGFCHHNILPWNIAQIRSKIISNEISPKPKIQISAVVLEIDPARGIPIAHCMGKRFVIVKLTGPSIVCGSQVLIDTQHPVISVNFVQKIVIIKSLAIYKDETKVGSREHFFL